jgi:ribokinase
MTAAISVVGSTMMDLIAYVERAPHAGETLAGHRFRLGFGGKGANQAVMARRLGADVSLVTCLGTDVFGDMTIDNLRSEGIDATCVTRTEAAGSGVALIVVESSGVNRIVCVAGANDLMEPDQAAGAVRHAACVDVVIGQLEIPQAVTIAAFRAARERGATCVLNPAPAAELDPDLIAASDWIIPNEVEFGQMARSLLGGKVSPYEAAGVAAVGERLRSRLVVTLGDRGAAHCTADGEVSFTRPPSVDAVDTTGAGDAFVGAFAYALARDLPELQAVRLGCACASASVTAPGTQASYPSAAGLAELSAWIRHADGPVHR